MILYNTMTRQKETFEPRESGKVSIYTCGPTTYNYFHVGNARMLVVFDMIRRYLMYKGYDVRYVQNFTDIDDKIIKRANEEGEDALALGQRYIDEYYKDAQALNILPATIHPKATEHIREMQAIILGLISKGLAYEIDGDVYFAVDRFDGYGKLSGRNLEDMLAGARVEVDERKHFPMDFALWKKAKPEEPAWESPWGMGRPGWHIECTAMSLKYLGAGFDIHAGGADLVFPHHENEIAQAEGYLDQEIFARYWMHNAFLTVHQEKMSKSLGNFFTVREVLEHFPGEIIRFYLLGTHYRSQLDFDQEKLLMAQKGLERLQNCIRLADEALQGAEGRLNEEAPESRSLLDAARQARADFEQAMEDDFNSSLAYAALFELAKTINSSLLDRSQLPVTLTDARNTLLELGHVLGFDLDRPAANQGGDKLLDEVMEVLLTVRARIREKKDWELADLIRDRLKDTGIVIEDTPQGARWQIKK